MCIAGCPHSSCPVKAVPCAGEVNGELSGSQWTSFPTTCSPLSLYGSSASPALSCMLESDAINQRQVSQVDWWTARHALPRINPQREFSGNQRISTITLCVSNTGCVICKLTPLLMKFIVIILQSRPWGQDGLKMREIAWDAVCPLKWNLVFSKKE